LEKKLAAELNLRLLLLKNMDEPFPSLKKPNNNFLKTQPFALLKMGEKTSASTVEGTKTIKMYSEEKAKTCLGSRVGTQAMLVKALMSGELILASSIRPPDLDSGPT